MRRTEEMEREDSREVALDDAADCEDEGALVIECELVCETVELEDSVLVGEDVELREVEGGGVEARELEAELVVVEGSTSSPGPAIKLAETKR